MLGHQVVFTARRQNLAELLTELRRAGLTPITPDHRDIDAVLNASVKGGLVVRIAVPDEQVDRAVAVIHNWSNRNAPAVAVHARSIRRFAVLASLAGLAILTTLRLALGSWERIPIGFMLAGALLALWIYSTAVGIRRESRANRTPRGHCRECGYNLRGNVSGICSECGTKIHRSWRKFRRGSARSE